MSKTESKTLTAMVWMHAPSKYHGTVLNILLKLAGLTGADGYAFPGIKTLGQMCGVGERRVRYCVSRLKRDGILKIKTRKGRANCFFIQVEKLLELPLAVPDEAEPPTPATSAEAREVAGRFHAALLKGIPNAVIPDNWLETWAVELQKLFDTGHASDLICKVARFAIDHEGWSVTLIAPRGASGFVEKFSLIERQYRKSTEQKAVKAA